MFYFAETVVNLTFILWMVTSLKFIKQPRFHESYREYNALKKEMEKQLEEKDEQIK